MRPASSGVSLMSFLMAMVSARRSARPCSSSFLASRSRMARSALLSSYSWRITIKSMASSMSWVSALFLLRFSCVLNY